MEMPLATALARDRHRVRPMASATPSGVATISVRTPRTRLFRSEWNMLGSSKTEPSLQQYHCREKPCQVLRDRPSLKENWMAISTGTRDQRMYPHVMAASTYGRRHGLRHGGTRVRIGPETSATAGRSSTVTGWPPCSPAG